jgi:hypothetical protein
MYQLCGNEGQLRLLPSRPFSFLSWTAIDLRWSDRHDKEIPENAPAIVGPSPAADMLAVGIVPYRMAKTYDSIMRRSDVHGY